MQDEKLLKLASVVGKLKQQVSELSTKAETITKLQGPQGVKGDKGDPGRDGKDGKDGINGRDGKDGKDGVDGKDGEDGVSVVDASVDFDGNLVLTLSDGSVIDAGEVRIPVDSGGGQTILKQQYSGPQIFVQSTEPQSASSGDLWFQTY